MAPKRTGFVGEVAFLDLNGDVAYQGPLRRAITSKNRFCTA